MTKITKRGFTLIELLLYIALSGIMILMMSLFLTGMIQSRIKNQTVAEVEQQGIQVMQLITQTLRNAEGINSPDPSHTADTLSINVLSAIGSNTIFSLSDETIFVSDNSGVQIPLTSDRVIVSDLAFKNLSRLDTPGIIRIEFTLIHINPEGRNEYDFSKTFYGSASLR